MTLIKLVVGHELIIPHPKGAKRGWVGLPGGDYREIFKEIKPKILKLMKPKQTNETID